MAYTSVLLNSNHLLPVSVSEEIHMTCDVLCSIVLCSLMVTMAWLDAVVSHMILFTLGLGDGKGKQDSVLFVYTPCSGFRV